jgi:SET domain-containing protein
VKARETGHWGVKTLDFIPAGSFVCEFLGKVISSKHQAQAVAITCKERGLEHRLGFWLDAYHVYVDDMHFINSLDYGNVSSFIHPNLVPNLIPVSVSNGRSLSNHKIALFALRDIYPNEELNYRPNYKFKFDLDKYLAPKETMEG